MVHGYYTIKPKQLWNIIEKDIPVLMPQIKQLLDSEKFTEEQARIRRGNACKRLRVYTLHNSKKAVTAD